MDELVDPEPPDSRTLSVLPSEHETRTDFALAPVTFKVIGPDRARGLELAGRPERLDEDPLLAAAPLLEPFDDPLDALPEDERPLLDALLRRLPERALLERLRLRLRLDELSACSSSPVRS